MRPLVDAFFADRSVVNHHIASYNDFLDGWLQAIIDRIAVGDEDEIPSATIQTDIEDYHIKLGQVSVAHPVVKEADGSERLLSPMEARLRDLTYEAPMTLEFIPVIEGIEHEPEEIRVGSMPIMVKSNRCNIARANMEKRERRELSDEEYREKLIELQEDPADPGGYFIINGSERVLISLEDLAPNRVLCEFNQKYGRQLAVAKVFSQREGYRALVIVEMKKEADMVVSVPAASGQIPLVVLLRALGMETDEDIVESVVTHPDMMNIVLGNIEEATQEHGVTDPEEAVTFLGRKLAGGQAKEYRIRRVENLMDRSLLPHLGNDPADRMKKAMFLGRMARAVLELHLGMREEDDKDHYANKRLKLAGNLMEDLFRVAFKALAKDLKYQLERAHSRNRELKVSTAVRSDVLSQRLFHALATGNWVGGRAGVSQLLERTSHMATVSHLRRVVSPLTRSQPHFEARDLHPTQWGRLCPNETPEGPNCGMVKNYALCVEISEGTDQEELERTIMDLGVKPIKRTYVDVEATA